MLATGIIFFREVLEAALIISIVMAATKGVAGRGFWVALGILLGIAGACLVAGFAGAIAQSLQGRGQELFNAAILLLAVMMLGWHNVWMSQHGRELAQQMRALGHDVVVGDKTLSVLLVVVMLATLREGSEVVLFAYGIYASGVQSFSMLIGALCGLALGAAAGVLLYKGLLKIPTRYLFSVTSWMILLLAAGLAADAAGLLTQAGVLPAIRDGVWNTAWLLNERTLLGQMLHILVGYSQRPSMLQIIFYVTTLLIITSFNWLVNRRRLSATLIAGK